MPVQTGQSTRRASGGDDRVPMLEREVGKLRREVEALKGRGVSGAGGLSGWISMALAAVGTLLGLMALLRH